MMLKQLLSILHSLKIDTSNLKIGKNNWVQVHCPLAPYFHEKKTDNNPSMGIRVNVTPSVFHCFSCHEAGPLWGLVESVGLLTGNEKLKKLSQQIFEYDKPSLSMMLSAAMDWTSGWEIKRDDRSQIYSEKFLKKFVQLFAHLGSIEYLKARNIGPEAVDEYKLLYDYDKQRIVFPVRDLRGNLLGAVGRTICDEKPKYYNYWTFPTGNCLGGFNKCSADRRKILVTEGFFDVLNVYSWAWKLGFDIVCTFKAEISGNQAKQLLNLDKTIYMAYDGDAAGSLGIIKSMKLLRHSYGLRYISTPKGRDFGDFSEKEFIDSVERAVLVD